MKALLLGLALLIAPLVACAQTVFNEPFAGVSTVGYDATGPDSGVRCFSPSFFCTTINYAASAGGQGFVDYNTLTSIGDNTGYFGVVGAPTFSGAGGTGQELVGAIFAPEASGSGTFADLRALESGPGVSSGTITDLRELNIEGGISGTGGATLFRGVVSQLFLTGSGNIGEYDVWADLADSVTTYSGTVTTERGLHQTATNHPNDLASTLALATLSANAGVVCTNGSKVLVTSGCNVAPVTGHDAQTAVAGAASSSSPNVVVTSEALSVATTYTLTLTDSLITPTSIIQCTPADGAVTGVQIKSVTPGSGSVVIVFQFAALTGTIKAMISIFN